MTFRRFRAFKSMNPLTRVRLVMQAQPPRHGVATNAIADMAGVPYATAAAALCDLLVEGTVYADCSGNQVEWRTR